MSSSASPLPSRRSEIVEVVEKVSPAVVNIAAEQTVRRQPSVFDDFFFGRIRGRATSRSAPGVIIDPKGIILTNDHVISGASKIIATTKDGQELDCDVVGSDADNDLAVLKARGAVANLPDDQARLVLGPPDRRDGRRDRQSVRPVEHRHGRRRCRRSAAASRRENQHVYSDFLQIDALDQSRQLRRTARQHPGRHDRRRHRDHRRRAGHRLRDPGDRARRIVDDLLRFGEVRAVWIGLHGRTISAPRRDRPRGFRVRSVEPGSPADRAGIKAGDQIVSIDEKPIDSEEAFETALSTRGPGKPMKIVLQELRRPPRTVTLSGQAPPADFGVRLLRESIGLTLRETRDGLRLAMVESGGAAARPGSSGATRSSR